MFNSPDPPVALLFGRLASVTSRWVVAVSRLIIEHCSCLYPASYAIFKVEFASFFLEKKKHQVIRLLKDFSNGVHLLFIVHLYWDHYECESSCWGFKLVFHAASTFSVVVLRIFPGGKELKSIVTTPRPHREFLLLVTFCKRARYIIWPHDGRQLGNETQNTTERGWGTSCNWLYGVLRTDFTDWGVEKGEENCH